MLRLLCSMLLLFAFLAPAHAQDDGELTPQERYELGRKYMKRGYYTKALEQLNRVRNYHRDDPVSIDAELAIADLYFRRGDYEQARLAYEDFKRLHPRYDEMDYVVYKIGMSIYKRAPKWAGRDQTPTRHAVNTWTGFSSLYPESEYRDEVEELLDKSRERLAVKELNVARFYARRDASRAVRMRTARLLDKYPESEHVPEALALRGEALHAWGFVDRADGVRERLAEDFPKSSELARLDRVLATEPGSPPEEEVFVRPYRVPSTLSNMPAGGPGAGGGGGAGAAR